MRDMTRLTRSGAHRLVLRKHYDGCYRTTIDAARFGQIKRLNSRWEAEIRNSETGELIRYAGIWQTRKEALDELLIELDR